MTAAPSLETLNLNLYNVIAPHEFVLEIVFLKKVLFVWTIKENYRLGADIQSKVLAFAFGLSAEIERKLISDRTKSSLDKLKKDGKKLGRPVGAKNKSLKLAKNRTRINNLLAKGLPKAQIARILGVDKMTMYRFLKDVE